LKVIPNDRKLRYGVIREQFRDMDDTLDSASAGQSEVIEEVIDAQKGKSY
jgi:hypothetical protein